MIVLLGKLVKPIYTKASINFGHRPLDATLENDATYFDAYKLNYDTMWLVKEYTI